MFSINNKVATMFLAIALYPSTPSNKLSKNLTGADTESGSQEKRASLNLRRGAKGDYQIPCSNLIYAFGDKCFNSKNSFLKGTINIGYIALAPRQQLTRNTLRAAVAEAKYISRTHTVSTKPTKALALPEEKITPLELGPVFCKNRGGNYKDISPGAVKSLADTYCKANLPINIKPDSPAARITKSDLYYYKVKGCKITVESQNPYIPLRNDSLLYKDLFIKAYAGYKYSFLFFTDRILMCWVAGDNGGIRGYIDAGCIRYMFLGAQ
ncbi:unnamed protein product [Fusarium fujikuroi]|nr:unnamed protein product [Fusarium fujikuroi]